MKWIANISRIITGLVFMFSGFVKGVDPLGFAYKLEDYFIAYQWDFLMPYALLFSILLCALEFTVGVMLVLNLVMRFTSWVVFGMMIFFTGLTLYDAIYSPVPDCGCFGSAIILTNWETFYKNVFLIVLAFFIFLYRNKFSSGCKLKIQWITSVVIGLIFIWFSYYNFQHLPVIDFTEWKIGNRLYPENPKPVKFFVTYKNNSSGEKKEFLSPNYPYNDSIWMSEWSFDSQRTEDPNEYYGKSLSISDTLGNTFTDAIVRNPGYQVIINAYNLKTSNVTAFKELQLLADSLATKNIHTAVVVSGLPTEISKFASDNKLHLEFYISDDVVLKTMVRSNPGMLVLKAGVIKGKYHFNDLPDFTEFVKKYD